jgi:hypothetical protein
MKQTSILILFLPVLAVIAGCATTTTTEYSYRPHLYQEEVREGTVLREFAVEPEVAEKILALDPDNISEKEIQEVLSHAPAPRIINIHGGIYPVYLLMISFSEFLISMGYPEESIRNPMDGSYSYSCYMDSEKIAGLIAWYYEREGMRPMMVGHSQGGIQAVKVLYELAGRFDSNLRVWNPLTDRAGGRSTILDPISGEARPVVSIKVSYATAVGAGGFTRFLINQWSMLGKLRSIPDSVEEFTGFYMGLDIAGGDLLGFGSLNKFKANGKATVRNVKLPLGYSHITVPGTRHLAESQEIRDWINEYVPVEEPQLDREFNSSSKHILWAADVWHSIKKHWVLELQRVLTARMDMEDITAEGTGGSRL